MFRVSTTYLNSHFEIFKSRHLFTTKKGQFKYQRVCCAAFVCTVYSPSTYVRFKKLDSRTLKKSEKCTVGIFSLPVFRNLQMKTMYLCTKQVDPEIIYNIDEDNSL